MSSCIDSFWAWLGNKACDISQYETYSDCLAFIESPIFSDNIQNRFLPQRLSHFRIRITIITCVSARSPKNPSVNPSRH